MNTVSILVIDDEPQNFDVIEEFLTLKTILYQSQHQYRLHYAPNGLKAIHNLHLYNPDLILLDLMMPGMDGIQVCQKIKAMSQWQAVPIIMITALNSKSTLSHCLDAGADDFINKPINPQELRARVNCMLRLKKQYDSIQSLSHTQANVIRCLDNTLEVLRGNLVTTLAHELNTPIQGLVGMIDLLTCYREQMQPDEVNEILSASKESAYRLESLIKRVLFYLELELQSGSQQNLEGCQTSISAQSLLEYIKPCLRKAQRQQDIRIEVEDDCIANIPTEYLAIIMEELTHNALKFSSPNTEVFIHAEIQADKVVMTIKDHGRGMTSDQIASIGAFMQFERQNYEQQGLGMGLKIVKKIIDMIGGEFALVSEYQQHTSVCVTLPRLSAVSPVQPKQSEEKRGAKASLGSSA